MREEVQKLKLQKSATLKQLQSLIGMLTCSSACKVVPPSRTFLRRLIVFTVGLKKIYHHRRPNSKPKADLTPENISKIFNGKVFFPSGITHSSTSLHLFTDAVTWDLAVPLARSGSSDHFRANGSSFTCSCPRISPNCHCIRTMVSSVLKLHCDSSVR